MSDVRKLEYSMSSSHEKLVFFNYLRSPTVPAPFVVSSGTYPGLGAVDGSAPPDCVRGVR